MAIPTRNTWRTLCSDIPPGRAIYDQIGQDLQIAAQASGFVRYRALGILHTRIRAAFYDHGGAHVAERGELIEGLAATVTHELKKIAYFVGQNEYGTVGFAATPQRFVFSTGFYQCLGIVIHDQGLQRASFAHKAPATAPELAVDALLNEFADIQPTTSAFVFGGGDAEIDEERRNAVVELLRGRIETINVVSRSDLSVDNGYGMFFDRQTGAHDVIREAPHQNTIGQQPEISVVAYARRAQCTTNDGRGARAVMLSASRVV